MTVDEARDVALVLPHVSIPADPATRAAVDAACCRLALAIGGAVVAAVVTRELTPDQAADAIMGGLAPPAAPAGLRKGVA